MRILFISYNEQLPIYADVIQNQRLVTALSKNAKIDICCRRLGDGQQKYSVYSPNLFFISRIIWKLKSSLRVVFNIDTYIWSCIAYRILRRHIDEYDYVFVTYEPYSIHTLLHKLYKYSKVPIVSIMYDSLVENCFFPQGNNAIKNRLTLEKQIIDESKFVVLNNSKNFCAIKNRYDAQNIFEIPLCGYSKETLTQGFINNHEIFRIVHAGSVHGVRRLDEMLISISYLKRKITNLSDVLEILIVGRCSEAELKKISQYGHQDVIKLHGYCSQSELLRFLQQSDALLLLDPMIKGNYSFPSKLCEYTQMNKPILAFAEESSPSYNYLKTCGHYAFTESESDKMGECILSLMSGIDKLCNERDDNLYDYSPESISQKYLTLCQK